MSADTTPVILITDGEDGGLEFRVAIAQAWENAWEMDEEGEILNSRYVVSVFKRSPVVASTIDEARDALVAEIESWEGYVIEYPEQVLDLAVGRPLDDLEVFLGLKPTYTYRDLVDMATQWQIVDPDPRYASH